jgi:hypothetical protein
MLAHRARSSARGLAFALLSCALACGGGGDGAASAPGPTTPAPATPTCETGDALTDGACQPLLAAGPCAPGTRAALGSATCVPVGTTACAPGFSAHASGWGCVPVLPAAACAGATRDALGSATCAPVGDCAGAFPPAGATAFVDASFSDVQLDATHFRSLRAAVEAAPANATLAVAAGTYAETLDVTRAVTLVGRCAEKVLLEAPTGAAAIAVSADLTLRGVTVRGGTPGLEVGPAAHASLADVVLEQNLRAGIVATDGARVEVVRSVIRATQAASRSDTTNGVFVDVSGKVTLDESAVVGAADAGLGATGGGTITLRRSVVRDVVKRPDGVGGSGARAFEGGIVSLEESAVVSAIGTGILAGQTKGGLKLVRSTVLGTRPDLRFPGGFATAASLTTTGTLDATDSTFADNSEIGVAADHVGSRATLEGCVVVGTLPGGDSGIAIAASAANGATLQARSSAFVGSRGLAVYGLHAGATVELDASLVSDVGTTVGSTLSAGRGGTALAVVDAAHASVTASTIEGCHELAVGAIDSGTTLLVERTLVTDTLPNGAGLYGDALMGRRNADVTIRRSVFRKSAGIGLAFSGATASVEGSFVRENAVGIHVQDGSSLGTGVAAPQPVDALTVFVTDDTRFEDNATRVGSGVVPLPDVITPNP